MAFDSDSDSDSSSSLSSLSSLPDQQHAPAARAVGVTSAETDVSSSSDSDDATPARRFVAKPLDTSTDVTEGSAAAPAAPEAAPANITATTDTTLDTPEAVRLQAVPAAPEAGGLTGTSRRHAPRAPPPPEQSMPVQSPESLPTDSDSSSDGSDLSWEEASGQASRRTKSPERAVVPDPQGALPLPAADAVSSSLSSLPDGLLASGAAPPAADADESSSLSTLPDGAEAAAPTGEESAASEACIDARLERLGVAQPALGDDDDDDSSSLSSLSVSARAPQPQPPPAQPSGMSTLTVSSEGAAAGRAVEAPRAASGGTRSPVSEKEGPALEAGSELSDLSSDEEAAAAAAAAPRPPQAAAGAVGSVDDVKSPLKPQSHKWSLSPLTERGAHTPLGSHATSPSQLSLSDERVAGGGGGHAAPPTFGERTGEGKAPSPSSSADSVRSIERALCVPQPDVIALGADAGIVGVVACGMDPDTDSNGDEEAGAAVSSAGPGSVGEAPREPSPVEDAKRWGAQPLRPAFVEDSGEAAEAMFTAAASEGAAGVGETGIVGLLLHDAPDGADAKEGAGAGEGGGAAGAPAARTAGAVARLQHGMERITRLKEVLDRRRRRDWAADCARAAQMQTEAEETLRQLYLLPGHAAPQHEPASPSAAAADALLRGLAGLEAAAEAEDALARDELTRRAERAEAKLEQEQRARRRLELEHKMVLSSHAVQHPAPGKVQTVVIDVQRDDATHKQLHKTLLSVAAERDALVEKVAAMEKERGVVDAMMAGCEARVRTAEEAAEGLRGDVRREETRANCLAKELPELQADLATAKRKVAHLQAENQALALEASVEGAIARAQADEAAATAAPLVHSDEPARFERAQLEVEVAEARQQLNAALAEAEAAQVEARRLRGDVFALQQQLRAAEGQGEAADVASADAARSAKLVEEADKRASYFESAWEQEQERARKLEKRVECYDGLKLAAERARMKEEKEKQDLRKLMAKQQRAHEAAIQSLIDKTSDDKSSRDAVVAAQNLVLEEEIADLKLKLDERDDAVTAAHAAAAAAVAEREEVEKAAALADASAIAQRSELLAKHQAAADELAAIAAAQDVRVSTATQAGGAENYMERFTQTAQATVNYEAKYHEMCKVQAALTASLHAAERRMAAVEEQSRDDLHTWTKERTQLANAARAQETRLQETLRHEAEKNWELKRKLASASSSPAATRKPLPSTPATTAASSAPTPQPRRHAEAPKPTAARPPCEDVSVGVVASPPAEGGVASLEASSLSPSPSPGDGAPPPRLSCGLSAARAAKAELHAGVGATGAAPASVRFEQHPAEAPAPQEVRPAAPAPSPRGEAPKAVPEPPAPSRSREALEAGPKKALAAKEGRQGRRSQSARGAGPARAGAAPKARSQSAKPAQQPVGGDGDGDGGAFARDLQRRVQRLKLQQEIVRTEKERQAAARSASAPRRGGGARAAAARGADEACQTQAEAAAAAEAAPACHPKQGRAKAKERTRARASTGSAAAAVLTSSSAPPLPAALQARPAYYAGVRQPRAEAAGTTPPRQRPDGAPAGRPRASFPEASLPLLAAVRDALVKYHGTVRHVLWKFPAEDVSSEQLRCALMPCGLAHLGAQYAAVLRGADGRVTKQALKQALSAGGAVHRGQSPPPSASYSALARRKDPPTAAPAQSNPARPPPPQPHPPGLLTARPLAPLDPPPHRPPGDGAPRKAPALTAGDVLEKCAGMDKPTRLAYHRWLRDTFLAGGSPTPSPSPLASPQRGA